VNAEDKQRYLERYKAKKHKGEFFWPDTIARDAVISLMIFMLLLGLVILVGVPNEPPANPSDTAYVPRPEWYFLWTFQLLKYFPGKLEGIAIVGLGVLIAVGLFGLPFFDRNSKRHPLNRPLATSVMAVIVVGMVLLTIGAMASTPPQEKVLTLGADLASRIEAGGQLCHEHCAECHGENGEGAEITTSPGDYTDPLNSEDFLLTHTRDTIIQVISYGQPDLGMQAFGLSYGGQLTGQEIRAIVDFIQAWYVPPEEAGAGPDLSQIENPSFATDLKPLVLDKRCATCHSRRLKGHFSVASYDKFMTSGDYGPVIIPGDAANSTLAQMLQGIKTDAGGQMPPARQLSRDQIQLIERWINQGAQNN